MIQKVCFLSFFSCPPPQPTTLFLSFLPLDDFSIDFGPRTHSMYFSTYFTYTVHGGRRVRWGAGRGQSTDSGVHLLLLILPDGWKFLPRVNIHVIVVWVHFLHKREFLFSASWHLSTEADFWLVLQDNKRWCFIALIRTEFYFSFTFVVDTFLHKGKWNIILDTCTLIQHLLPFAAFALSFKKIA